MNKKLKIISSTALLLFTVGGLLACNKDNGGTPAPIEEYVSPISLNETNKELSFGSTFKLIPTFLSGDREEVIWTSSNSRVVEVDQNGLVIANGIGKAIVFVESASGASARCDFVVSFGETVPTLTINHIFGDELILVRGDSFTLEGNVTFNNNFYEADLLAFDYDEEIIEFDGNSIKALKNGSTSISLQASWSQFDPTYLTKNIAVKVVNDVEFYTNITVGNTTKVTNHITLYTKDRWGNQAFDTSAIIVPQICIDHVVHNASFSIEDNGTLITSGGSIYADNPGSNLITVFYNDGTSTYSTKIYVDIIVPETKYLGDKVFYSVLERFPIAEFFDSDAVLLEAYQGGKLLTIENGVLVDMIPNGDNTLPLKVVTNRGCYYFEEIYGYTKILNKENLFDTLLIGGNTVVDGFYMLEDDIIDVDMTKQQDGSYNKTYFCGTFDGRMHTVKALVGENGIFGGLGDGAIITNTHFEFTFNGTGSCSGLAKNGGGFYYYSVPLVTISNVYVTTTNYRENTYSLMEYRIPHMILKDVFVKLSGTELMPVFTDPKKSTEAALFGGDKVSISGPSSYYTGDIQNVHVVTGKFIPISNKIINEGSNEWIHLAYGKNDIDRFGKEGEQYEHYVPRANESGYCYIIPKDSMSPSDPIYKFFGHGNHWQIEKVLHKPYAQIYLSTLTNGGIARYDYVSQMTISKVGSWDVK